MAPNPSVGLAPETLSISDKLALRSLIMDKLTKSILSRSYRRREDMGLEIFSPKIIKRWSQKEIHCPQMISMEGSRRISMELESILMKIFKVKQQEGWWLRMTNMAAITSATFPTLLRKTDHKYFLILMKTSTICIPIKKRTWVQSLLGSLQVWIMTQLLTNNMSH